MPPTRETTATRPVAQTRPSGGFALALALVAGSCLFACLAVLVLSLGSLALALVWGDDGWSALIWVLGLGLAIVVAVGALPHAIAVAWLRGRFAFVPVTLVVGAVIVTGAVLPLGMVMLFDSGIAFLLTTSSIPPAVEAVLIVLVHRRAPQAVTPA